jgi:diguanylate cyclase (GGDEF)-like protein/PAS domain S-box-containing protein
MRSQAATLEMHDYAPPAKVYWWTTFVLGTMVLLLAVVQVAALDARALLQVLAGVALAAVTGLFPVRIPGRKTSVAGAEIFVFLLLLFFGPAAAALAAACEAAVGSYRTSNRLTSRLGSPAMAGLAMYGCGSAFTLALGGLHSVHVTAFGATFAALLVTALAYFASGTLLMASLLSLKQGKPVRPLALLQSHGWLALAFAASASIAGLIHMTQDAFGATVLLVAAPIIAMFLSTIHLFFRQAEADERAAAETARHMAALQASEERFHSAFTHAAVGMVLLSRDGRILQTNEALRQQLGRSGSELVGKDLAQVIHPDDIDMLRAEIGALVDGGAAKFATELRCLHANGDPVWVASDAALFNAAESGERCLIMQLQDVSARKRAEARLHHIAYHDGLTNLPNRSYFLGELARAVAAATRDPAQSFAVMFLDFDRFKTINDSLGHGAGDELLVTSAQRLRGCLRPSDLIARLGGDEFAILVEGVHSDGEVVELAERVQRAVKEPLILAGTEVTTSASIGITTSALHYLAPEDVMRDADIAMYTAKAQGKARYAMFDRAAQVAVASQLWMEGELRRAIDSDQLTVEFQPIFDLRTRHLYGFEALARWPHPDRGLILPDQFIPLAEETGLIAALGNRILENACMHLARWRRTLPSASNLHLHVNVSPLQLAQPGFAMRTLQIIKTTGVPAEQITLEVTENVLAGRHKAAIPNLQQLREAGVRISIDDFGSGYSSLSAVEDLPIGEFKIDRTFVGRLALGKGEAVVSAILALGRSMGKGVIVEGIETTAQLEQLLKLGCERGQGYLFGRPLPADYAEIMTREAMRPIALAYSRSNAAA